MSDDARTTAATTMPVHLCAFRKNLNVDMTYPSSPSTGGSTKTTGRPARRHSISNATSSESLPATISVLTASTGRPFSARSRPLLLSTTSAVVAASHCSWSIHTVPCVISNE